MGKLYKLKKSLYSATRGGVFTESGVFQGDESMYCDGSVNDFVELAMNNKDSIHFDEYFEEFKGELPIKKF